MMEVMHLKAGSSADIQLTSRGSIGLQMIYKMDHMGIAEITRTETAQSDKFLPGETIPAIYQVRALKAGTCIITFYETQPWDKTFAPVIRKEIQLEVSP